VGTVPYWIYCVSPFAGRAGAHAGDRRRRVGRSLFFGMELDFLFLGSTEYIFFRKARDGGGSTVVLGWGGGR
jgi:hypothetical protein